MPGLVGFVKSIERERAELLLSSMARALEPETRFSVHLYQEGPLGLGRVSLEILNPGPQPVWNEDGTICLCMEGEILDYQELKKALVKQGHRFQLDNDAEFALHLYEQYGEEFSVKLNGAYVIAIWDKLAQKLVVTNDRLGLYPLYYAETGGGLIFASGVRALAADASLPRQVDRIAMAEFLTFDHALGDRTLFEAVRLMPQACVMTYVGGRLELRPYWTLKYADVFPLRDEQEYVEELLFHLRRAVARCAHDELPSALMLSGGLDSRVLLALLMEQLHPKQFHTFTWGIPGCDDSRYARELSALVKTSHAYFELKPDWLLHKAEEGVRITDGLGNIINLHALAALEEESLVAKVIYKGFLGDAMMGYGLHNRFWTDYDAPTQYQAHMLTHHDQGLITFEKKEHTALFTEDFQRAIGDAVWESYRLGMNAAKSSQLAGQRLFFDLTQRVPRMTINGVEVVRSRAAVRLPFCDNDLVEFTARVPYGLLYQRHLITRAFIQAFPRLAKVPSTTNGLPLIACARDVLLRSQQLIQWHLHKLGLAEVSGVIARPYKDYCNWFRTVLSNWVRETMLSSQALERGYYQPGFIHNLIEEHFAGADHTVKLGALLSLELWHKQFVD